MAISVRELGDADAEEFGRLSAAIDADHPTPLRLSATEFREVLELPGTRFLGAFDDDVLVGWAGFLASVQPESQRFLVDGDVDPAHPFAVLGVLLGRVLDAARAWHADTEPGLPVLFVNRAASGRAEHEELVRALGFAPERYRFLMVADLDDVPPPGPVVDGLTLAEFDPEDSELLREAHNEVFRDYPNGASADRDNWEGFMLAASHVRHHLSFVLTDADGAVASYAFAHEYAVPVSGRDDHREVYLPYIGTAAAHRTRGLASDLIGRVLHAAAAEGYTSASLDVDAENPAGALGVYERAGFRQHHTFVEYALREPAGE
ncbi:GNAT family N-acetyltransferase [Nocardioides sp. LS1]|uniref:GNAT family N-acetyltransferase n=1 Tax=Nocardioides sp. LS1 TaxID=1027620 RepID=UPI000F621C67|nr:GNAT family N-acetyltransferase [Nocardioides sp. LS1]